MQEVKVFLLLVSLWLGCCAEPTLQKYELKEKGAACFIAEISGELVINYKTHDGTQEDAVISLPAPDAPNVVDGNCGMENEDLAFLHMTFHDADIEFSLNFTDTSGEVELSDVELHYKRDSKLFPNSSETGIAKEQSKSGLLSMGKDTNYYQCRSSFSANISDHAYFTFYQMKVQAFNVNGNFSKDGSICDADTTTTAAPSTTTGGSTAKPTSTLAPTGTPAPVSTPAPTTPTTPESGNWTVRENDVVCIVAKLGVRFIIPYVKKDKTVGSATVDLPTDASDTDGSSCGNHSQILALTFYKDWLLEFTFTKEAEALGAPTKADPEYSLDNVSLTYYQTVNFFPDSESGPTVEMKAHADGLHMFRSGVGYSFICHSKTPLSLTPNVTLDTYDLQLQAFKTDNSTDFGGKEIECTTDSVTDSIVPIAVGAALAALVAIVLVAYIIGRKRSRTGYESV